MRRRVEQLKPFRFESDFSAPSAPSDDTLTLTSADLAALLAETRQATADLVRNDTLGAEAERLNAISEDLKSALSAIVNLASLLEKAAIDEHDRRLALNSVQHIARTLVDGQGELFSKSAARSPLGNHSD
jgi:K+-sensing histidine kinase KdpD